MTDRQLGKDIVVRFAGLGVMASGALCGMAMDRLKQAAAGAAPSILEFGLAILCVAALFAGAAALLCGVKLFSGSNAAKRHSGD